MRGDRLVAEETLEDLRLVELGCGPAQDSVLLVGHGEAGLQISPWWSQDVDGRLNVRTTDGEIACFGGRLPFYNFTASHGINYTKGNTIHVEIRYEPNGLSQADPGTIQYTVGYLGQTYSSGVLAFEMDGVFIGATWSEDMRNMMLLSLVLYLAVWAVAEPLWGAHGLWLAMLVFLSARGFTLAWRCRARTQAAFA